VLFCSGIFSARAADFFWQIFPVPRPLMPAYFRNEKLLFFSIIASGFAFQAQWLSFLPEKSAKKVVAFWDR